MPSLASLAGSGQVEAGHKKGWGGDWRPEGILPHPKKAQAQIPVGLFRQGPPTTRVQ